MAKERTINEIRQTKEYYTGNTRHQDQEAAKQMAEIDYQEWADKVNSSEEMKQNRCPLDPVEEAKILIVDKISKHLSDIIFEKVCNEMGNHYVFQSQNYLTEAGYDQFEDEWFEFYHEHHGDIMHEVMQNITN